ncbi:MAG: MFS transporter [Thermoleophilia bacterium]|nr:MFS transporter [Thermoleophilia bacterium]
MNRDDLADGTTARELLANPMVARLLASELLATLSFGIISAALGWQAYARTGDPLTLGIIGICEFVPALLLALPAGQLADRVDRRYVTAAGNAATVLFVFLLLLDAWRGDTSAWPLYALAAGLGGARAFAGAAFNPMLAAAVTPRALPRTMALSSSAWQSGMIVGPLLGGIFQALGDVPPYAAAIVVEVLGVILVLSVTRRIGTDHKVLNALPARLSDATAGLRLIIATPALLGAISLDLVAVLFGGATALLPVVASDILGVGEVGYGILRAAPGVGAVLVGILLSVRPIQRKIGPVLLVMVGMFGGFTIIFGLSESYWLSLLALAGLAAADMISVFIRSTLGPLLTPASLRGRVGAAERVFIGASNELGAFESGVMARLIGTVPAIVLGGVASIGIAALWAIFFPALRKIDRFEDIEPAETDLR